MEKSEEGRRRKSGEEETVSNITHRYTYTHTHTHKYRTRVYYSTPLSRYLVSDETDTEELENVRVPHVRQGGRLVAKFLEV